MGRDQTTPNGLARPRERERERERQNKHKRPNESGLQSEVEMVLVVGTRGRLIPEAKALEHVMGITVGNDVSARDWQLKRYAFS